MTPGRAKAALLRYALSFPGAWEGHPWGEDVAKVGKKVFVFFGRPPDVPLMLGVKLPRSLLFARTQPFVVPFGYGMDRHGWVAAQFKKGTEVPVELMKEWIAESYEAIAPRAATSTKRPAPKTRPRLT
jgi:predicted DNA-binding protein (MmcQ/YjbR family)